MGLPSLVEHVLLGWRAQGRPLPLAHLRCELLLEYLLLEHPLALRVLADDDHQWPSLKPPQIDHQRPSPMQPQIGNCPALPLAQWPLRCKTLQVRKELLRDSLRQALEECLGFEARQC